MYKTFAHAGREYQDVKVVTELYNSDRQLSSGVQHIQ